MKRFKVLATETHIMEAIIEAKNEETLLDSLMNGWKDAEFEYVKDGGLEGFKITEIKKDKP